MCQFPLAALGVCLFADSHHFPPEAPLSPARANHANVRVCSRYWLENNSTAKPQRGMCEISEEGGNRSSAFLGFDGSSKALAALHCGIIAEGERDFSAV